MIRRPMRTALHSALSALAGGFKGYAQQEEQRRLAEERRLDRNRQDAMFALSLADRGAVARPRPMADAPPSVVPMPEAPPPPLGSVITAGETEYVVPSLEERERRQRASVADEAESVREANNRRAHGALGIVDDAFNDPYDPSIDYASALQYRLRLASAMSAKIARPLTAGQQADEEQKERVGLGYLTEFGITASTKYNADERNRFWQALKQIQRSNPSLSVGRAAYDAFLSLSSGTTQAVRRDPSEPDPDDIGAGVPVPPPGTGAPATAVPATAVPAAPATPRYTAKDYDDAFTALGADAPNDAVMRWLAQNRRPQGR